MKRAIFENRKCHYWNGDMLVKYKNCRHKLRKGEAVKTLILDCKYPLDKKTKKVLN